MRYQYTAVDYRHKKSHGFLNADSKADAIARLQSEGLTALSLTGGENKAQAEPTSIWKMEITGSDIHKAKIKKKKLLTIMNQMGIMMKAGVSLSMAMEVLISGEKDKKVKQILEEMNSDLYTGIPISEAMAKFRAFPKIVTNIIQSGEANGRLDTAFERCAKILDKEIELTAKLKGATGYPIFLLCLTLLLMMIMNVFVLPNFANIFKEFNTDLPVITRFVMALSSFIMAKWYFILLVVFILIFTFIILKKKYAPFATAMDRMFLRIPAVGSLMRQSYIARLCRIMSSLVESGVDIVKALEISRDVIPNRYMKEQLTQIVSEVKFGSSINASMAKFPIFDALLVSMIKVGEESGMLFETLDKMASMYEQQTDESTKKLTSALEPAMTIIIAVIVGTVVISIVVPMFSIYSVISGS
ncbi:type II secretion system F family protein [Caproiciproducens faecalis]|uniref:Type II secretion system F family protein n=1 Tax=Caproiciproducens faecalis TaxID=2820301 RepID=A0ABS7DJU2_9FIRM|nr:type II secretion system F family protein [Caproiciproducens faecalis]MBW7571548.1 type II secretion system F family protein [Caproiciproducens faecalis]